MSATAPADSTKPDTPTAATLPAVPGWQENPMWILLSGIAALLTALVYVIWKKAEETV